MAAYFTQRPHDPGEDHPVQPRIPASVMLWVPLTLVFGLGIFYAGEFGYQRASEQLEMDPNPAAANETRSEPFIFDPGEEPIVFAMTRQALRNKVPAAPGSSGSRTVVIAEPIELRIVERDGDLARVLVVGGERADQYYWAKARRLLESKDASEREPPEKVPEIEL